MTAPGVSGPKTGYPAALPRKNQISLLIRTERHPSKARLTAGGAPEPAEIPDKGEAVRVLKASGRPVVAVGESAGNVPMFREADLGLAFAGLHAPAPARLAVADQVFDCGAELCALLGKIISRPF